ncbi:MAG TPA: helix-turn-helix domain-containing protein [Cyclobacteriaceae bacterium]|jgi:AraC-like DNA-binding protein|nr:helix-turn-helix domain-containing protein [Cyclobacteriaceae bacterium]
MTYKLDLFAIFIFLGIVQAVFLSLFFFSKENRKIEANVYEGLMVLSMAGCTFEIFLCYTGYIQQCLWLVDFSEPLAFIIGPSFYLMVVSLIHGKTNKTRYYHFIIPLVWFLIQIPFLIQSNDVKFNAWIGAYHPPGLTYRDTHTSYSGNFFSTPSHSELILTHLAIYMVLGLIVTIKAFGAKKESFWKTRQVTFKKLRSSLVQTIFVVFLVFIVKIFNYDDTGDHLFAAYISIPIYLISFYAIRQSGFFKQSSLVEQQKYKSSSITPEQQQQLLTKLNEAMNSSKPYLKPDFSLPELADQLRTTVHQLSQVINDGLGKSFFEMTAEYRIEEAKWLLKEQMNVKIEEIAEQVGYNSKSSFNTSFKKITGKTPSEWRG